MTTLMAAVRCLHFVCVMAAFGASAYLSLWKRRVRNGTSEPEFPATFFFIAACGALASALVSLPITVSEMSGSWSAVVEPSVFWSVLSQTRFGMTFTAGLALLVALVVISARTPRSYTAVCAIAGLNLVSVAATSHAAAANTSQTVLLTMRTLNDAMHLLAGGFWFGSLLVLARVLQSARDRRDNLLAQLRFFSLWGTYAVVIIVTSGVLNAAAILQRPDLLFRNAHGRLLSVKIVLAMVMIVLAAINRWRIVPAMRVATAEAGSLAKNVVAEIGLALAVIGIAAYLGVSAP